MQKIVFIICFVASIFFKDYVRAQLFCGTIFLSFFILMKFKERFEWKLLLPCFYFLLQSIFFCFYPESQYLKYGNLAALSFNAINLEALLYFSGFLLILYFKDFFFKIFDKALCWLAFADACILLFQQNGIMQNYALDGSFIAIMFSRINFAPVRFMENGYSKKLFFIDALTLIIPTIAILKNQASVVLGCFILMLSLYVFLSIKGKYKYAIPALIVSISWQWGILHLGPELFHSTGRFEWWQIITKWFLHNADNYKMLFGFGPGSFYLFGPHIQSTLVAMREYGYFVNTHNEFLQIFFEFGLVGLLMAILAIWGIWTRLRSERWQSAAFLSFLLLCLLYNPLRYFNLSILGMYLVVGALRTKNNGEIYDTRG